jgi:ribosome assembly protein RRB1
VFASCSVDGTIQIWDARQFGSSMITVKAHDTDVNVLSWNPLVPFLLVSGCDDGSFKVWDLKSFKA